MKRLLSLTQLVQLAVVSLAYGAGFISKATAEHDALKAVGGGTIVQAVLEQYDNPPVWSVDIVKAKPQAEYEVKVNARTGAIVAVIVGG
jgi:uncharacterized membrane protein YkoI